MCSLNLVLNKKDLIKMELLLLETFGWNLCMPTPAHFIDYYLHASVQEGDLYNGWPLSSLSKTKAFMDKYTHYFLEVSLQGEPGVGSRKTDVKNPLSTFCASIYLHSLIEGIYFCRSCLPEFPTISGCSCVCGGLSNLPSNIPELDDCAASADRLHLGPPDPVH